jgi:anaerobic selenocysteine-containing dehydrogenase
MTDTVSPPGVEGDVAIRRSACPMDCPDACSLDVETRDGRVVALRGSEVNPVTQGWMPTG